MTKLELVLLVLLSIGVVWLPFMPPPNRYIYVEPWAMRAGIWWGFFGPVMLYIWYRWLRGWRIFE